MIFFSAFHAGYSVIFCTPASSEVEVPSNESLEGNDEKRPRADSSGSQCQTLQSLQAIQV